MAVRIIHQVDEENEYWFLDGINFREGRPLKEKGFHWISGPDGGCWHAPDKNAIQVLIDRGMEVRKVGLGNGRKN